MSSPFIPILLALALIMGVVAVRGFADAVRESKETHLYIESAQEAQRARGIGLIEQRAVNVRKNLYADTLSAEDIVYIR